ncbi:hypothetical protein [Ponticoccus alexandrii]|uniref:Uncharacterized protein n=1 Tax=Ponticoccus alexandrii TaxID=1943633 RepID=A0ABX7F325_9RHOB|nr:hypothetical protein [Ponticoccus alexandrii]ETA51327.1 hypothetical protein P279_14600 [Rhodobacteraceae bacterium PD-2]QRF64864.1 hypothetical protein GQA70_00190 [Ponticoccus alexandrii]
MAAVAFVFGSLVAFVASLIAYAFTDAGFGTSVLMYFGGSILLGTSIVVIGKVRRLFGTRREPEAQTSF